ncbi:MAG: zeta toxin family protein [Nitrospirota bacterium]|nr:zeta toxin family protein [Nitrospirota bacterium]
MWFGRIFSKSHVKTYTRSDGTIVREHNDKRAKAGPEEKHPRGPAKETPKKGSKKGTQDETPRPETTEQPKPQKVTPAEEGQLAAWIEQIMQEPDIKAAMEEVDAGTPTDRLYKMASGEYQPVRARLHERIVASLLNPRAVPEEGQRPHAVIFMGRPASGKTTALGPAAKELGVEFTIINADDVKEKLPEYNKRNAGVLHEESSDIAEGQLLPQALDAGHHLLLDMTGANVGKVSQLVETFHQLGYEISVMLADLPIEKACARAVDRFRNPDNGRFVPPRYIFENVDHKPEKTYDVMKRDPRVAHWRRYNNDVEEGEQADLRDQGRKDVAGNPFNKSGPFDAIGALARPEGVQSLRRDGGESDGSYAGRTRQSSQEVPNREHLSVSPVILRAYELRDTLTKSIHYYDIDLASPDLSSDVRGTILAGRHHQSTRLHQLNDLLEKAEA